jgi:opacity protein-like surface antigen
MRAVLCGALAAGLISLSVAPSQAQAPTQASAQTWQTFPYADLHFSAPFPSAPARNDSKVDTVSGPAPSSFVGAQAGSMVFGVTVGDYSGIATTLASDPQTVAQAAMDGATRGRTVTSATSFAVPGGAGRETVSSGGGLLVRIRVYYHAPRVYIVMAGTLDEAHPEAVQGPDASRFYSGFTILP